MPLQNPRNHAHPKIKQITVQTIPCCPARDPGRNRQCSRETSKIMPIPKSNKSQFRRSPVAQPATREETGNAPAKPPQSCPSQNQTNHSSDDPLLPRPRPGKKPAMLPRNLQNHAHPKIKQITVQTIPCCPARDPGRNRQCSCKTSKIMPIPKSNNSQFRRSPVAPPATREETGNAPAKPPKSCPSQNQTNPCPEQCRRDSSENPLTRPAILLTPTRPSESVAPVLQPAGGCPPSFSRPPECTPAARRRRSPARKRRALSAAAFGFPMRGPRGAG